MHVIYATITPGCYIDSMGLKKDNPKKDKSEDKRGTKEDEGFPAVHDCYMIYGGPST